jgi:hypothetical protein
MPVSSNLAVMSGFCRFCGEMVRPLLERSSSGLSRSQHPCSQQVEARSSVTLSFQQFELVDEALHAAVAPLLREPRPHRVEVLPQAAGEILHSSRTGLLGVL